MKRLKDVSTKITDGSHNPPKKSDHGVPMYSAQNVFNGYLVLDNFRLIKESDFENENKRTPVEAGDVLLTIVGTIGRSYVVKDTDGKFALQRSVALIKPEKEVILPSFLCYYLQSDQALRYLNTNSRGVAQKGIYLNLIREMPIPLPSIEDQRRIVMKIEEHFSQISEASTNLKTLKHLRKSYLQSLLKILFTPNSDWRVVKSAELFEYVTSGSRGWAKYYSDDNTNPIFYRVTNVNYETIDLDMRPEKMKYVALPDAVEGKRTRVQANDILISITGYVGMIGLVPEDIQEAYISQHISLARPIPSINPRYLAYYLSSRSGGLQQFEQMQRGATKAGLTLGDIKNVNVPVAPRDKQDEIVAQIEKIVTTLEHLQTEIKSGETQAQRLKQSILSNAFKGEAA